MPESLDAYLEPGVPEATQVSRDLRAPADERNDAAMQVAKAIAPAAVTAPRIDMIKAALKLSQETAWEARLRAMTPRSVQPGDLPYFRPDPQQGQRPGALSFQQIRALVAYDSIASAIIYSLTRKMSQFAKVSRNERELGFRIRFRGQTVTDEHTQPRQEWMERFVLNCGAEFRPLWRERAKRDDLATYLKKASFETLSLDAMPVEIISTYTGRPHGWRVFDGSTVYLAPPEGFGPTLPEPASSPSPLPAPEDVKAIRYLNNRVQDWFAYGELLYPVRNPRTDLYGDGYGTPEIELMVRFVTGFINLTTYNLRAYEENHIPKGFLTMFGDFKEEDIEDFKSEWRAYVAGVNNAWKLPILISQGKESGATFTKTGVEAQDMAHIKWLTFLVSIHCSLFGVAPESLFLESFSSKSASLSDSSQEAKLETSQFDGLEALKNHHSTVLNQIIQSVDPDAELVFTGHKDPNQADGWDKLTLTFGEAREMQGRRRTGIDELDNAPINPAMQSIYMQALAQSKSNSQSESPDSSPGGLKILQQRLAFGPEDDHAADPQ